MIDLKLIRTNYEQVISNLNLRNTDYTPIIIKIKDLDLKIRNLKTKNQEKEANRNQLSKSIAKLIDVKNQEKLNEVKIAVTKIKNDIEINNNQLSQWEIEIKSLLLNLPNLLDKSVPQGKDESNNVLIRSWGQINKKTNIPHWEIAEKFGLVDFTRGTKLSGSRFVIYTDLGAKLMRALSNFMLDENTKNGYQELLVPLIVNEEMLIGTGQLPKFYEDQFQIAERKQFLIPTAEVPLTNLYSKEILSKDLLPIKLTSYSQCFRLEAGAAGRDNRGLIRMHQFQKVELVQIVNPENSFAALEEITKQAEALLQKLEIPYQVVALCSGDIGFSATKTYDLNLWMPGQKAYREVSSCSNCSDFQARRMELRVMDKNKNKYLPHTLNGSGLAVDRVFAALIENNYESENEIIRIPKILHRYMQQEIIRK